MNRFLNSFPPSDFNSQAEVAICLCELNGELLFLKTHSSKLEGGRWSAPGGKLEKGESPEEGALRELFEETGIRASPPQLLYLGQFYARSPHADFVVHLFKIFLNKKPLTIELSPSEHVAFIWTSPTEALKLPLMHGADECLKMIYSISDIED